jgi:hypothetical protein
VQRKQRGGAYPRQAERTGRGGDLARTIRQLTTDLHGLAPPEALLDRTLLSDQRPSDGLEIQGFCMLGKAYDPGGDISLAIALLKICEQGLQWTRFSCQGFGGLWAQEETSGDERGSL